MATPENPADKPAFDIDKAYNTKGFVEFMALHPDAKSMDSNDAAAIEQRMKVFEMQAAAAKGVFEALDGHVKRELGIEIDPKAAREEIQEYILGRAVEDPAEVAKIQEAIVETAALKGQIAQLQAELGRAGRSADHQVKLGEESARLADLEKAQKASQFVGSAVHTWNRIKSIFNKNGESAQAYAEVEAAKQRVEALHGRLDRSKRETLLADTAKRVEEINKQLADSKDLEDGLARANIAFEQLRGEILSSVKDSEFYADSLQTAVANRFRSTKVNSKSSLSDLLDAQADLEKIVDNNATGVDLFDGVAPDEIQANIDKLVERKVAEMAKDSLKKFEVTGGRALDRLRKDLEQLIKADKLGSKEAAEAKALVKEALVEAAESLKKETPENIAKVLVINRIIATL